MPHVSPGDLLEIKAADWTKVLETIYPPTVEEYDAQRPGSLPTIVLRARNDTGVDLPAYAGAPLTLSPATELLTSQPMSPAAPNNKTPVLTLRPIADFDEDNPSIAITIGPIASGRVGPVVIQGLCWAQLAPSHAAPYRHNATPAATLATGAHAYKLKPISEGPIDLIKLAAWGDMALVKVGNHRRPTRAATYRADATPLAPALGLGDSYSIVTVGLTAASALNSSWTAGVPTKTLTTTRAGQWMAAFCVALRNEGRAAPLQAAFASDVAHDDNAIYAWDTLPTYNTYDGYYPIVTLNAAGIISAEVGENWKLQVVDTRTGVGMWKVLGAEVSLWRIW